MKDKEALIKVIADKCERLYKDGQSQPDYHYESFNLQANTIFDLCATYQDGRISEYKAKVIDAINNEPFALSSTEFPDKREHQEEGLDIAIKVIKRVDF